MSADPFIWGKATVTLDTDDWAAAHGARLTDDDEVVPVIDLTPHFVDLDWEMDE